MSFIGNLCRFGMFFIDTELFRRLFVKFFAYAYARNQKPYFTAKPERKTTSVYIGDRKTYSTKL